MATIYLIMPFTWWIVPIFKAIPIKQAMADRMKLVWGTESIVYWVETMNLPFPFSTAHGATCF